MTVRASFIAGITSIALMLAFMTPVKAQEEEDHSQHHAPARPAETEKDPARDEDTSHAQHARPAEHAHHQMGTSQKTDQPRTPIPLLTDADREAAFPSEMNHPVHDKSIHYFALLDRLEVTDSGDGNGSAWEAQGWIGTDLERFWIRSEGERFESDTEHADVEVLYGRSVSTWWDVVGGLRHDFGAAGPSQTFAAFGVQGLAPYLFEIEATAYIGESGQTGARFEAEYDTLITNRLVLQWQAEIELYGKDDPERGIGAGLNTLEAGARLRYEVRREFAPYIGFEWERRYGEAAEIRRSLGEDATETRLVAGVRIWF